MRTLVASLLGAASLLLAAPPPAAADAGPVALCTSTVDVTWDGLFRDAGGDGRGTGWSLGAVGTATGRARCAGTVQTLSLLDHDGTPLWTGRAVLDAEGRGRYDGIAVPVEDVWHVQVLLVGDGPAPAGPLARTGGDLGALSLRATTLILVGAAVLGGARARQRAREGDRCEPR